MRKYISLGSVPTQEESHMYEVKKNLVECEAFRKQLMSIAVRGFFGKPHTTCFTIKPVNAHHEVCVEYTGENKEEESFALSCAGNLPTHWDSFAQCILHMDADKVIRTIPFVKSLNIRRIL